MDAALHRLKTLADLAEWVSEDLVVQLEAQPDDGPMFARMIGEDAVAKGLDLEQIASLLAELAKQDATLWNLGMEAARREVDRRAKWQKADEAAAGFEPADKPTKPSKPTNLEVAELFAAQHGHLHRYVHTAKVWMSFDGVRWRADRTGETAAKFAAFCAELGQGGRRFINDTEALARNLPTLAITAEAFDADPWLLATPAGYVDLRTGTMTKPVAGLLVTKVTGVAPSKDEPTRWLKFMREVTDGNRELEGFLQRWFGYCLTGDTREQVFTFVQGPAGSGKSSLVNTIGGVMGDYHKGSSIAAFLTSRNSDPNAPQPYLADMAGARFVTMAETKTAMVLDGPTVARLTGNDPVTTRTLHGRPFTYRPTGKVCMFGNQAPGLSGSTAALARRVLVAVLPVVFKGPVGQEGKHVDKQLEEALKAEYAGILQWLIDGCLMWQRDGLRVPASVAAASRDYVQDAEPVTAWISERVVQDAAGTLVNREAFADWVSYARANGHEAGATRAFYQRLTETLGVAKVDKGADRKSIRLRRGWRLVAPTLPSGF